MKLEDNTDQREGQGNVQDLRKEKANWLRRLTAGLVALGLLVGAYCGGYAWYGRTVEPPVGNWGGSLSAPRSERWNGLRYQVWAPGRWWEARREKVQVARELSGTWRRVDKRAALMTYFTGSYDVFPGVDGDVEVRLKAGGKAAVASRAFPPVNWTEAEWSASLSGGGNRLMARVQRKGETLWFLLLDRRQDLLWIASRELGAQPENRDEFNILLLRRVEEE